VEKTRPVDSKISSASDASRGFDYEPGDPKSTNLGNETIILSTPQRGPSFRDRSYIPVAVGSAGAASTALNRSGSNKLKKDPPGDPWLYRRTEAEKKYPDVIAPRKPSVADRPQPSTSMAGPSRDTAFRSHPQDKEKEPPVLPAATQKISPTTRERFFLHFPPPFLVLGKSLRFKVDSFGTLTKSKRLQPAHLIRGCQIPAFL
jgi:hypothetical protein